MTEDSNPTRRNRHLLGVAIGAALLAIVVGAYLSLRPRTLTPAPATAANPTVSDPTSLTSPGTTVILGRESAVPSPPVSATAEPTTAAELTMRREATADYARGMMNDEMAKLIGHRRESAATPGASNSSSADPQPAQ